MLRRFIKHTFAATLDAARMDKVLTIARGVAPPPLVVGYHQVVRHFLPGGHIGIAPMQISVAMLERHLDWIGARYEFVSLEEIGTHYETGRPFAKPVAAVTFDDGYRDVYTNAFPLLKRKGVPAAIFVVTDTLGTDTILLHDRLHAALTIAFQTWTSPVQTFAQRLELSGVTPTIIAQANGATDVFGVMRVLLNALPHDHLRNVISSIESDLPPFSKSLEEALPLTWEMVEEMSRAGLTIGSHTKSHVLLPVESGDRQLDELMGSRNILGRVLGASPRHFAYPDGRFDARSAATVSAAGYRFAYTTCNHRLSAYPLLTIPRRMLWEQSCVDSAGHFSPSIMNCQVYGVFDWFTRCPYTHDYAATNVSQALGGRNRATRAQWHGGGDA